MTITLCHNSALEFWRSRQGAGLICAPKLKQRGTKPSKIVSRRTNIESFGKPTAAEIRALEGQGFGFLSRPIHVLVSSPDLRCRSTAVKSHVCSTPIPEESIVQIGSGLYTLSPEACFVSLGCEYSSTSLMKVGYELCGSYSLFPSHSDGFYARRPLTNVESIEKCIADLKGIQGAKPAKDALRFVLDGSASPMETNCVLFYYLPLSRGGCSLSKPSLNHRIDLPANARKLTSRNYFVCDSYWESAKLDVEYDSEQEHSERRQRSRDAERRNVLAAMGITVVTLTADQMLAFDSAWASAQNIAQLLHARIRVDRHSLLDTRRRLHRELFNFSRRPPDQPTS